MRIILLVLLAQLFLLDCDAGVIGCEPVPIDSLIRLNQACGNFGDNLPVDSAYGPWPYLECSYKQASKAPNLNLIATTYINSLQFHNGSIIYDLRNDIILKYLPNGRRPKWNSEGNMLLTVNYIYSLFDNIIYPFPKPISGDLLYIPEWSIDSKNIYYSAASGIYRSDIHGDSLVFVGFKYGAIPISENELLYFKDLFYDQDLRGYEIYNINSQSSTFIRVPEIDDVESIINLSLSPDRTYLAADIHYNNSDRFNRKQALGIFNLSTHALKTILPAQAFGNYYYPSWSSDSSLLISFVCRLDSSSTIWEIDTNGVFLHQLTNKNLCNAFTDIVKLQKSKDSWLIHSPYPNPSLGEIHFEYDFPHDGIIEFQLYDLLGRMLEVQSKECLSAKGFLSLKLNQSFPPGLYFMKVVLPDKSFQMKKISLKN